MYSSGHYRDKVYQDYTNSGIKNFEETDIYRKAISIGGRRVVDDGNPVQPPTYDRTTVRTVEVPYSRQVRVPTVETKIVPTKTMMTIPVKKMVEVPSYRIVDEEYVDWEEREAVRDKEIWVKQIVQEKYVEKVPVKRTRQVRVPHKDIQEVEELEEVEVNTTKAVSMPGYRIDEVQDSKLVEVEEKEKMEWHPNPTGDHTLTKTVEGDVVDGPHYARRVGAEHYARGDPLVSHLPVDTQRSDAYNQSAQHTSSRNFPSHAPHPGLHGRGQYQQYHEGPYSNTGDRRPQRPQSAGGNNAQGAMQRTRPMSASFYRKPGMQTTQQLSEPRTLNASQPMEPTEEPRTSNGSYGWETSYTSSHGWCDGPQQEDPRMRSSAGEYSSKKYPGMERGQKLQSYGDKKSKGLGMSVKTTATAHTNSYGVVVTKVQRNSVAAKAGLRENDIIVECQGRSTTTIEDLGSAIQSAGDGAAICLFVNRDGRKGQQIVVYRD